MRKVSQEHNSIENIRALAAKMKDPHAFPRGDIKVRNMRLTVLTFVKWVRPCGLYNMTILEWDGRLISRDGRSVVVRVADHKTGPQFGAQPVIPAIENAKIMENYLQFWWPKTGHPEEDKYFFLNSRIANLVNTGITSHKKKHLVSNEVNVPEDF